MHCSSNHFLEISEKSFLKEQTGSDNTTGSFGIRKQCLLTESLLKNAGPQKIFLLLSPGVHPSVDHTSTTFFGKKSIHQTSGFHSTKRIWRNIVLPSFRSLPTWKFAWAGQIWLFVLCRERHITTRMMWVAPASHFNLTTFILLKDIYYIRKNPNECSIHLRNILRLKAVFAAEHSHLIHPKVCLH
jgi:hypothetical protein